MELNYRNEDDRYELSGYGFVVPGVGGTVSPGGHTYTAVRYGAALDLAFVDHSQVPVAWYHGRGGGIGRRLVVAPDREYTLRTFLGGPWKLREGRALLATIVPHKKQPVAVDRVAAPEHYPDEALLLLIACYVVLSVPVLVGTERIHTDGGG